MFQQRPPFEEIRNVRLRSSAETSGLVKLDRLTRSEIEER
jgi:hypothetical protein